METVKMKVALADMAPSGVNPREDFGDIERLARSIEATGGQPVNPIIAVADGGKYRIVDGERRFRALRSLGAMEAECLVFPSYSGAQEAVAMMATDDKQQLSERERAKGFQLLLDGMVDSETGAKALGVDVESFRRAKRARRARPDLGQLTLDALVIAGDPEFSDEERERILAAEEKRDGGWYGAAEEAKRISEAHRREERIAELRAALPASVEVRDEPAPGIPRAEGLVFVDSVRKTKDAEPLEGREGLVAYRARAGACWEIYRRTSDGEEDEEAARRAELRKLADETEADAEAALASMLEHELAIAFSGNAGAAISERVRLDLRDDLNEFISEHVSRARQAAVCGTSVSAFEIVALFEQYWNADLVRSWDGRPSPYACGRFAVVFDMARADGWKPSKRNLELRALCDAEG